MQRARVPQLESSVRFIQDTTILPFTYAPIVTRGLIQSPWASKGEEVHIQPTTRTYKIKPCVGSAKDLLWAGRLRTETFFHSGDLMKSADFSQDSPCIECAAFELEFRLRPAILTHKRMLTSCPLRVCATPATRVAVFSELSPVIGSR
jgi:hypothetical protein